MVFNAHFTISMYSVANNTCCLSNTSSTFYFKHFSQSSLQPAWLTYSTAHQKAKSTVITPSGSKSVVSDPLVRAVGVGLWNNDHKEFYKKKLLQAFVSDSGGAIKQTDWKCPMWANVPDSEKVCDLCNGPNIFSAVLLFLSLSPLHVALLN